MIIRYPAIFITDHVAISRFFVDSVDSVEKLSTIPVDNPKESYFLALIVILLVI